MRCAISSGSPPISASNCSSSARRVTRRSTHTCSARGRLASSISRVVRYWLRGDADRRKVAPFAGELAAKEMKWRSHRSQSLVTAQDAKFDGGFDVEEVYALRFEPIEQPG